MTQSKRKVLYLLGLYLIKQDWVLSLQRERERETEVTMVGDTLSGRRANCELP